MRKNLSSMITFFQLLSYITSVINYNKIGIEYCEDELSNDRVRVLYK